MPAATLHSLDDVRVALPAKLGAQGLSMGPISTRVLLRTGASLKAPRADQNSDPVVVAKVIAALIEMGYQL